MPLLATQAQFAGSRDWSPAEVRDKLFPEDRDAFEQDLRDVLHRAADTLTLDELEQTLEGWRRTAWMQHHMGRERYEAMLDRARRIQAGERFPGARPWREVKAELGL
jgi:hypothetical protein